MSEETHARMAMTGAPAGRQTCLVRLFDRRTGLPHRIDGRVFTVLTRNPTDAARTMLRHRDRRAWEVRVTPIGTAATGGRS